MMILLSQIWLKVVPFAFALAEGGEAAQAFDFTPMGVWRAMGSSERCRWVSGRRTKNVSR
jgi:hypothetical protein